MSAAAAEPISPELILVSPPEVARAAREALGDFEAHVWLQETRRHFEAAAAAQTHQERVGQLGAITFTALLTLNCVAAFFLPILLR